MIGRSPRFHKNRISKLRFLQNSIMKRKPYAVITLLTFHPLRGIQLREVGLQKVVHCNKKEHFSWLHFAH